MAIRTWTMAITPPSGVSPDSLAVSIHYLDEYVGDMISNALGAALAGGIPDGNGDLVLDFDDQDIPQSAVEFGPGEYVLYLFVTSSPWGTWLLGPYDLDGDPLQV